jgi:hypothetical protein
MSATAIAIAEASKEAMYDEYVMDMARDIIDMKNDIDEKQMLNILFHYSAQLTAITANLVTKVLLTEEQMTAMIDELSELEELGKEME